MSIESINSTGVTYQGSASQTSEKQNADAKTSQAASEKLEQSAEVNAMNGTEKKNEWDTSAQESAMQTESIKKVVENINKNNRHTEAIFGIHEGTNRVMIKIVDKDTKKVIKEYPPEKTLDMIEKVWEMAGLMIDEKR